MRTRLHLPEVLSYWNSESGGVLSPFPGWAGGSTAVASAAVLRSSAASLNSWGVQAV